MSDENPESAHAPVRLASVAAGVPCTDIALPQPKHATRAGNADSSANHQVAKAPPQLDDELEIKAYETPGTSLCPRHPPLPIEAASDGTFAMRTGPDRFALACRVCGPSAFGVLCLAGAAIVAAKLPERSAAHEAIAVLAMLLASATAALGTAAYALVSPLARTYEVRLDPDARAVTLLRPVSALWTIMGRTPSLAEATVIPATHVHSVLVREVGCGVDCLIEVRLRNRESHILGSRLTGCLAPTGADVAAIVNWWRKSFGAMRGKRVKAHARYEAV